MIAMSVASMLLVGVAAGYAALGRASQRFALAQAGLTKAPSPRCRPAHDAAAERNGDPRYRCTLPERCEYDTVSQSCRSTISH